MKKIDLPLILDVAFYAVAAWFLSLGILRYFRMQTAVALAVSTLVALAAGGVCFLLIYRSHKRRFLSRRERERREKLMLHLALEREERVLRLLKAAFEANGDTAALDEGALFVDGVRLIPLFTMQPASADAVAHVLRTHGGESFRIACNALTPEAARLLLSFGMSALTGDEIFTLIENTHTMPEVLICGEIPRPKLKAKLHRAFSKKNARPFFTGGILLLVMSLFTFFPLYYLISGSVLLLTAVFVRFLGYAS